MCVYDVYNDVCACMMWTLMYVRGCIYCEVYDFVRICRRIKIVFQIGYKTEVS